MRFVTASGTTLFDARQCEHYAVNVVAQREIQYSLTPAVSASRIAAVYTGSKIGTNWPETLEYEPAERPLARTLP